LGRWRAERVMGQHPHPERPGQLADPAADAAVADDADGGAVEVADHYPTALGPAALADQPGQGPQPLDQVQGHRQDAFGDGSGAAAGRDHDGDPAGPGRLQVDQVDPDPGTGDDPQPGGTVEEGRVDDRVGAGDGAGGHGQGVGAPGGREGQGSAANDTASPSTPATRAGSTCPRATTTGRSAAIVRQLQLRPGGGEGSGDRR